MMMPPFDPFSANYRIARERFRQAASRLGARLEEFPLDVEGREGEELAVDVACLGAATARSAVVISSGLHGGEGFLGSAIQLACLRALEEENSLPSESSLVLVHAINPFGFSWLRRVNEENIDLNRNFLLPDETYEGAPQGYRDYDRLLNPKSPPSRLEPFRLKAMWYIWRYGMTALKNSVAVGQYEFEKGLFFGGHSPARSTRVVQDEYARWIGTAENVVHIDIHSGLGEFGRYKLLVPDSPGSASWDWYNRQFGSDYVQPATGGIAYPARGMMGLWLTHHFADRNYRFLGAEFGTYPIVRVLGTLRSENRAHHYLQPGYPAYELAKDDLRECFCPESPTWRKAIIEQGLQIVHTAIEVSANSNG